MNHLLPVEVLLQILAVSSLGSLGGTAVASYVASRKVRSRLAAYQKEAAKRPSLPEYILKQKTRLLFGQGASPASAKSDLQGSGSSVLNSQSNRYY